MFKIGFEEILVGNGVNNKGATEQNSKERNSAS